MTAQLPRYKGPAGAVPHITCGSHPHPTTDHACIRTAHPRVEHCGGCGWAHERDWIPMVGPCAGYREALRLAGRKAGHVEELGETGYYVVSGCCRNVRESASWHAARTGVKAHSLGYQRDLSDAQKDELDAQEAWYERNYASSYGLGL